MLKKMPALFIWAYPGIMFAEDLTILADTPENVQSTLNTLYMYCEKWALKWKTKDSSVWSLGVKTTVWYYNGNPLEQVTAYR